MHMHMDMDISRTARLSDTLLRQWFIINARLSSSYIVALVITLNILGHWHPHYWTNNQVIILASTILHLKFMTYMQQRFLSKYSWLWMWDDLYWRSVIQKSTVVWKEKGKITSPNFNNSQQPQSFVEVLVRPLCEWQMNLFNNF